MGFLSRLLMPHVVGDAPQDSAQASSPPPPQSQPQAAQSPSPQRQIPSSSSSPQEAPQQQQRSTTRRELTPLQRQLKQFSFFMFGAGFMAASVAVARRAVLRRQREALPLFFQGASPNRPARQLDSGDRSLLAAQAFGLATLNVASFGVLMTGGIAWAFDLCSMEELRERTQAALRRPAGEGLLNTEDEQEMEKMMDSLLQKLGMDVSKEEGGETATTATTGEQEQQQQQQQQKEAGSTK